MIYDSMTPGECRTIDQPLDAPYGPKGSAFHPDLIILAGTPTDWLIRDILIDRRSQLSRTELRRYRDGIPGEALAATSNAMATSDLMSSLDIVEIGEIMSLVVTNIGTRRSPFVCSVIGTPR